MSDIDSSLPVRSEADGADARVQVKVVDYSSPGVSSNQMEVSENLAHIRNFGQDPADAKKQLRLSEKGETAIDGTYDGSDNTNPSNIGIVAQERDETSDDARQTMKPTAKRGTVASDTVSLDVSLHDEDGEPYSSSNPMPVSIEESEGTEVQIPNTSGSVAAAASVNHDYTVTSLKTFVGDSIWASGSGKIKVELKVETGVSTGTFTTLKVGFNSTSNPNVEMPLRKIMKVAAGIKIRITITNRDLNAQDVYSTIEGVER